MVTCIGVSRGFIYFSAVLQFVSCASRQDSPQRTSTMAMLKVSWTSNDQSVRILKEVYREYSVLSYPRTRICVNTSMKCKVSQSWPRDLSGSNHIVGECETPWSHEIYADGKHDGATSLETTHYSLSLGVKMAQMSIPSPPWMRLVINVWLCCVPMLGGGTGFPLVDSVDRWGMLR